MEIVIPIILFLAMFFNLYYNENKELLKLEEKSLEKKKAKMLSSLGLKDSWIEDRKKPCRLYLWDIRSFNGDRNIMIDRFIMWRDVVDLEYKIIEGLV